MGRSKQMVLSQLRASLAAFGPPPTPGSREAATPRDAAPATPDYELILERYKFLLELGEEMPEDLVAMVTPRPACRRPCSLGCVFTPMPGCAAGEIMRAEGAESFGQAGGAGPLTHPAQNAASGV